ncbi:MAG: glycosyltransferase [Clostridia bacterium]
MPSILFVMKYPLHRQENLKRKFDGQMAAARKLGYQAYCIGYDGHGMALVGEGTREPLLRTALASLPGYEHTLIFDDLMTAVSQTLKRRKVDVLYLRYMPTFGAALCAIRAFKAQGGRLVIEYPTYPIAQENNRFFFRRQVFRYADHVLAKINPLVDLYALIGDPCGGTLNGRPAVNIVNGVDAEALPPHLPNESPTIRLLALASMSGWHGYDRILRSLAEYRGDADVRLEMVGSDGDGSMEKWRALTQELFLQERVTFHGSLYGDALNDQIAQCDVGVGSLGMYRYGLTRATTLKLREFMARGLPFISAVDDPTLPDAPDWILRVPNDDTPIDMAQVVAFARRAKALPELPQRMRAYAQAHMSWEGTLHRVLEQLNASNVREGMNA